MDKLACWCGEARCGVVWVLEVAAGYDTNEMLQCYHYVILYNVWFCLRRSVAACILDRVARRTSGLASCLGALLILAHSLESSKGGMRQRESNVVPRLNRT